MWSLTDQAIRRRLQEQRQGAFPVLALQEGRTGIASPCLPLQVRALDLTIRSGDDHVVDDVL